MNTLPALLLLLMPLAGRAATNVAPTVTVSSAAMRPGTTLMDVTYKITDPDDATGKVRALAFVNGTRSFANVIRPVTWAEGTEVNLGDAITTGVNHTLTWNVAADWSIDLGNIKVEILARDGRGLLPLNWIAIPAAGVNPAVTISSNVPTDAQVLDALFWLYADADAQLVLTNGNLKGSPVSEDFKNCLLVAGASVQPIASSLILKQMNLSVAKLEELDLAIAARSGVTDRFGIRAAQRTWTSELVHGGDLTATRQVLVAPRWVMNRYADGAVAMSDRINGWMWTYSAGSIGAMNHASAINYCNNLVYANHDDWGCPSGSQLNDIYTQIRFFPDVLKDYYWATDVNHDTNYYLVSMSSGTWTSSYGAYYVWPVRVSQ